MLFMCLTVPVAESASIWSTMFQEILSQILLESLTTMFCSYTLVYDIVIITHLFELVNSTLAPRVLIITQFTIHSYIYASLKNRAAREGLPYFAT